VLTRSRGRLRASALVLLLASVLGSVAVASPAEASDWRSQVPREASTHKGAPYQYGAAGPRRFDCSGLTMVVYRKFGKSLPHNASQQYSVMHHFAPSRMVPGDLLFWADDVSNPATIHHVALYAGNGLMVAAPHSGDVVKVQPVYLDGYIGAVRPGAPRAP
jgi:cell wall-associated NlpC family hydrolase